MIKSRIVVAAALLGAAGAANAGVSLTPAITTDYDFRGLSQSDESEVFQVGLNFTTESGFYAGAWASDIDLNNDAVWELDLTAGYAGGDAKDGIGYDVGAIMYAYPSSKNMKDIYEVFAGVSHGMFSGKLWVAPDNYGDSSYYVEGNVAVPLPHDFTLGLHAGYSAGDYWKNQGGGEYLDYSFGVSKNLGKLGLNFKYVNSNDLRTAAGRNAWIFTATLAIP